MPLGCADMGTWMPFTSLDAMYDSAGTPSGKAICGVGVWTERGTG
jgi:hypothetical protein